MTFTFTYYDDHLILIIINLHSPSVYIHERHFLVPGTQPRASTTLLLSPHHKLSSRHHKITKRQISWNVGACRPKTVSIHAVNFQLPSPR